ncbi:MAG: DUF748 domain-containing protein [Cyclobacteriaceae bacterium]|nr:DUF748 domain-containing protein [Cyclobacteriaceae bacterium]
MKKRLFLGITIIVLAILGLALVLLPLIVRKVVVNNSKEWTGRSISWNKFKLNYFTGRAKIIDFEIYEPDDSTVFASFDTLIIDMEPYRLISNQLVLEQLYLRGLYVNVVMNDSAFNFDDLVARFARASEDDSAEVAGADNAISMAMEFSNIELSDGLFIVHDAQIDKSMEMQNLDFFIPCVRLDQAARSEAGLRFDFKNGGFFQADVHINPKGGDFEAELVIEELDISGYDDFVAKYVQIGRFNGEMDMKLTLSGNINSPEETVASAELQLHHFELKDSKARPVVGTKSLRLVLTEANYSRNQYMIDSIHFDTPYLYFEMYDSTNNITELIAKAMPPDDTVETAAHDTLHVESGSGLYYHIRHVGIREGIIDFVDSRTGEPFRYHLSALKMDVDSISSQSKWLEMQSEMLLNKRGTLVAELGIDPNNPMELKLDYTIKDFMLGDLNIYSRYYMGFPILYGDMYYKAHTEIVNGKITSENKIIIHSVELGQKKGGLHDLPVRFALFLLKDKDGVITLDVPVRGDLKDPKVSVGKIVWNTFKNLIIKAAAAPVKLLAGLIGADPQEIASINYDVMDTAYSEKRQKQLDLLLQLELQKPELEIELIYLKDQEMEKKAIALSKAGAQFASKQNGNDEDDKAGFEAFLIEKAGVDTLDAEAASLLLVDTKVLDSIALAYDAMRIAKVIKYLKSARDSTGITVIPYRALEPKNVGSKPVFEIKYSMKQEHPE